MWIIKIALKDRRENHTTFESKPDAEEFYNWAIKQMSRREKYITVGSTIKAPTCISTTIMKREIIQISFSEIKE